MSDIESLFALPDTGFPPCLAKLTCPARAPIHCMRGGSKCPKCLKNFDGNVAYNEDRLVWKLRILPRSTQVTTLALCLSNGTIDRIQYYELKALLGLSEPPRALEESEW